MILKESLSRFLPYLYSILFLLVVITHVWLCWRVGEAHPVPKYDEAVYADITREMVRTGAPMRRLGEEPRFYYIHPYLQTFFWSLPLHGSVPEEGLQNPTQALKNLSRLRWVTTLFSIGTLCLIFGMFAKNAPGFGLLAATLLAFNPMWLKYSHLVYLEVPCAFWVMAAAFCYCGPLRKGFDDYKSNEGDEGKAPMYPALCGIALGAAIITKYLAILIAFPVLIMTLWSSNRPTRTPLILGFGFTCLTWPLYILFFGDLGEWFSQSFGRWSSFHSGQGGDPRTEWGVFQLTKETLKEFGLVHSMLFAMAVLEIPVFMVWITLLVKRRFAETGYQFKKAWESIERSEAWPILLSASIGFWGLLYVFFWLFLPTKDPKFLVIALPLLMVSATSMVTVIVKDLFDRTILGRVRVPLLVTLGLIAFLLAFPIDLLGLDNTRFKKLYPTDHAYTEVSLPHGQDFLPIAEDLYFRTKPGEAVPVGRQGPIIGYLADRPYQILYTENDPDAFETRLETSRYLVIDDTWEHCFGGLQTNEVEILRLEISKDYQVIQEVGHVKLLERK